MFTVLINDKIFHVEEGAPLKECLTDYGMEFPCGGHGKCGRCKIHCAALPISETDKRFLSQKESENGVRLACDKYVDRSLTVTCPEPVDKKPKRALSFCNVAVSIDEKNIEIGISDEELVDSFVLPNPLSDFGYFAEQLEEYQKNPSACSKLLRGAIGKKCVEIFESYGQAKAETTAICASGFCLKMLFGVPLSAKIDDFTAFIGDDNLSLPTENIYILPPVSDFVSGKIFCRSVRKNENSMLIDCGRDLTVLYIDKDTNTYAYMWEMDYSPLTMLAVRAAIRILRPEGYTPLAYLYGEHAYDLEEALTSEGINFIHEKDDLSGVALACVSARFRSRLEKDRGRTSFHDLLKDETFQEIMTSIQNEGG